MDTTAWVAGFRSAVLSPHEIIKISPSRGFHDQTLRQILHLDGGGEAVRVRLSNEYGKEPLVIAAARLAIRAERGDAVDPSADTALLPGTDRPLRFGGAAEVTVPVGEVVQSDPVELAVSAGTDLVLSLYLPEDTGLATFAHTPSQSAYAVSGNHVSAAVLDGAEEADGRYYVTGVDVLAPQGTAIAVAFGDSWLEGTGTSTGTNRRFPNQLNRRLGRGWVVNQGIGGNRLLTDEVGPHGLARFDRDVLGVPGATHVIFHFGLNDLGLPGMSGEPPATAEDLIEGYTTLAGRARSAGLTTIGMTMGPYAGTVYPGVDSPEGRVIRRQVNDWLRTSTVFDAVVDIAAAVQDPDAPDFIRPDLDSGDHLHLNDEGAREMAEAVDLALLEL
ncbi:GDSL family lipase [Streptomyces sp. ERV7]|uniref:SGNH/GDSL hydrolase family protein n=1 Tax=Streptomyces sp. ERV7 TaxID=1322334 RepID=UPI0007F5595A|nr:SGNH/GDSL hydrolase family protein [Streptomyces sp. ERV7]OAR24262.1 GDSL family lipase [Streptomyces sp. ERV7]